MQFGATKGTNYVCRECIFSTIQIDCCHEGSCWDWALLGEELDFREWQRNLAAAAAVAVVAAVVVAQRLVVT